MFDSLQPHGLQHAELPCPLLSPGVCSKSCPLSWWCHPTIPSSVVPFSSCPRSFPAPGSFPMGRLFASGDQIIGASASVLPMNIQDWFPLGLTGLISLLSKRHHQLAAGAGTSRLPFGEVVFLMSERRGVDDYFPSCLFPLFLPVSQSHMAGPPTQESRVQLGGQMDLPGPMLHPPVPPVPSSTRLPVTPILGWCSVRHSLGGAGVRKEDDPQKDKGWALLPISLDFCWCSLSEPRALANL